MAVSKLELANKEAEYYYSEYERIYNSFLFSLQIFGGDKLQRKRLIKSSLNRCDQLYERFYRISVGTGTLRKQTKEKIKRVYRRNFGNEEW